VAAVNLGVLALVGGLPPALGWCWPGWGWAASCPWP
jgi:hypothetical protein